MDNRKKPSHENWQTLSANEHHAIRQNIPKQQLMHLVVMFCQIENNTVNLRVVQILIPVMENAFGTAKNAVIDDYASLCTNPIQCDLLAATRCPATSQLALLVLTDVTY